MVVLALTLGLAGLLSSPDVPPVTVATWARIAPADFLATAATELDGTSETATYGPPYNNGTGSVQSCCSPRQTSPASASRIDAGAGLRPGAAGHDRRHRPGLAAALATYSAAPPPSS